MDVPRWGQLLHVWLHLVAAATAASDYFCENFYNDIATRDPLRFSVADNAPLGTVLKTFQRHPHVKNTVFFTAGDLTFMDFDKSNFALVTKSPLYPKADQTLQIFGNCSEYIEKLNYGFHLSLTVLLDVEDVNDPPIFANLPAYLRIKESQRVGSQLYKVVMKEGFDVKEKFASTLLHITNVTAEGFPELDVARFFSLNSDGSIFLQQPIDYETDPRKFEIAIHAQDLADPPLTADSTLTFYIQDVDDMSPQFQHKVHSISIIGEKPIKTVECRPTEPEIVAEDQDVRVKAEVHYEISAGPPGDWRSVFKLERTSGRLCQLTTIGRTLPDPVSQRLTFTNYTFKIKGYQVDNRRKYDTADLFVHVADSNQHAPVFDRKLYRVSVPEFPGVKVGEEIVKVKADDKDHGENNLFLYTLEGPAARWFAVDQLTGAVTVTEPANLDREIYTSFKFKVKASETSTLERLEGEARVVVTLEDLNDHAPEFNQHRYTYSVKDSLVPGSPIHQSGASISAHDRDSGDNGRVLYSVMRTSREHGDVTFNDFGRFTIDPDDGTLRLAGSLNDLRRRREHPVYKLEVKATDQARSKGDRKWTKVTATISVHEANDYVPTVTPKRGVVRVNESAPVGTQVHQVKVRDRDGDEDVYLQYKIIRGNHGNAFRVSSGGRVMINKALDRETTDFYRIKIHVTDGKHVKTTSLRIQVLDVNDNTPVFSREEYTFSVPEDPLLGTVLGHVSASDPDSGSAGSVRYSVKLAPGADVIFIRPDGQVKVRHKSILWNREKNSHIRLKLIASDGGRPPRKTVADLFIRIVDVNDNPPVFTSPHYHGFVYEDNTAPTPQVVTMDIPINATDADASFSNRDIRYTLSGTGSDVFYMDPVRADVITADIGRLDAERQQKYELTVTATDQAGEGLTTIAGLTITVRDQNDNAPSFTGTRVFDVLSNAQRGHKVGTLHVTDRDVTAPNNHLIYILKEGGNGKFAVDFQSGDITLVDRLDTDDVLPVYKLLVQALDGGVPRLTNQSTVTIRVPVNRAPIIRTNTTSLRLDEGLPPGALVAAMLADDLDEQENEISGNVEFFIMDETVPFEVSPHGLIRTKDSLDREEHTSYEFQLYVRDEGRPPMTSSTLVTVHVDDVNDHAPEFVNDPYEGSVVEDDTDPNPHQRVKLKLNISAIDRDATATPGDVRFSLHGDQSDKFTIDPRTGEISVSVYGFGLIDRETTESFTFKVRATDHAGDGLSGDADVIIHVLDVNDVTPRFTRRSQMLVVSSHVEVGEVLGTLGAEDGDATPPNNIVMYTLENDPYGKFAVNSHTGEVRALTGVFYPPRQESYKLTVSATDMGFPPRSAEMSAEIRVNKTDFNDHRPEFYGATMFYVNEQVPLGTLVGTVSVRDADHPDSGEQLKLSLHGDGPVPFKIDSRTGELRSTTVLDYDAGGRTYMFTVMAHDAGDPPRTSEVVIGVILDDVNDNPPRFAQPSYHHRVHTLFPAGTIVATPFAYDDIDSSNSVYRYELLGEGAGVYFYIDEHTGVVRTTEQLKDIKESRVEYKLVAGDVYNDRLKAEGALVIDVFMQTVAPSCCCKVSCDSPP